MQSEPGFLRIGATRALNNLTAKPNPDGSYTVQFGGCQKGHRQLSAGHTGLELHGPALPPAEAAPGWHVAVPGSAAVEMSPSVQEPAGTRLTTKE